MTNVRLRIFPVLLCTLSFPVMAGDFSMSGFHLNPLPDEARCIAMGVACTATADRAAASGEPATWFNCREGSLPL